MLTGDSNSEMQIVTAPRCPINEHLEDNLYVT
jgi:hypothetical protein